MGWPSWTVHYSQGKGITQTFFLLPFPVLTVCARSAGFEKFEPDLVPLCSSVVWMLRETASLGDQLPRDAEASGTSTLTAFRVFMAILAASPIYRSSWYWLKATVFNENKRTISQFKMSVPIPHSFKIFISYFFCLSSMISVCRG